MTEPQQPDPEPPAPPGTADRDVDVDIPIDPHEGGAVPGNEDVAPEAGATEPPD
jgi:hypothetical protein